MFNKTIKKIYRAKTPSTQSKRFVYFSEPWRLCVFGVPGQAWPI
jgi:hypothetical protein